MKIWGLVAGLVIWGVMTAQAQAPADLTAQGKEVFEANCAQCHRSNGEGLPAKFPALKQNPLVQGDPMAVIATVLNGRKGELGLMPAWKDKLDDRQVAGVVTYIRNAWGNKAAGVNADAVAALRSR